MILAGSRAVEDGREQLVVVDGSRLRMASRTVSPARGGCLHPHGQILLESSKTVQAGRKVKVIHRLKSLEK